MTINSPIIAAGPTQSIAKTYGLRVQIIPVTPGQTYSTYVDGMVLLVDTEPVTHGQLIIQRYGSGAGSVMSLYVAVDIGGTLEWKKAKVLSGVDRYTRRPVDRFVK